MKNFTLAVWLMLAFVLASCNLGNTPVGGGETAINGEPVVRIAAPLPNATFLQGVAVNIQAAVTNAGADIDRAEVAVDDQIIATKSQPNTGGTAAFSVTESWTAEGAGQHTVSVTVFRADGSSSAPAIVNIMIVASGASAGASSTPAPTSTGGNGANNTTQGQATAAPTNTLAPTNTSAPVATDTPSKPMVTFIQGANVRGGPSTLFNPPIGSFAANQTADILGKTPAGDWYKVRYYNGEGWVFAQLVTVSGDTSQIPTDAGPPIPTETPIPPTPVPATAVPQLDVNLVAGNAYLEPAQPRCNETFNVFIDIANFGQQANASGGSISVRDEVGGNVATTNGAFGIIQPGQTAGRVGPIPLTIGTNFEEQHTLTIVIDSGNAVAESNEGDNSKQVLYTLAKAGC